MECRIIEKYLKNNDAVDNSAPEQVQKHLGTCTDCQKYYRFVAALSLQKGALQKAPECILPNIEKEIFDGLRQPAYREPFTLSGFLLKPSLVALPVVLVIVLACVFLTGKNIGYVENLTERFNRAEFRNIRSGDVLYAGDNTIAAIRLEGDNELQLHGNTLVRMKSAGNIALSRGEISVLSGDTELRIETPDGLLLARNTDATIHTVARLENGKIKTKTTCIVTQGEIIFTSAGKETTVRHGQKVIVTDNGTLQYKELLADDDDGPRGNQAVTKKLFAAVESLCDCLSAAGYTPAQKGNHPLLFGKEVNENKFKVRVFWQEKRLHDLACRPGTGPVQTIKNGG